MNEAFLEVFRAFGVTATGVAYHANIHGQSPSPLRWHIEGSPSVRELQIVL